MITRPFPRPSILSFMCSMRSRESSSRVEVEEDDRSRPRLNIGDSIEDGGTIVGGGIGRARSVAMQGVGWWRGQFTWGDKEVTRPKLVAKVVMKVLGCLLGEMVVRSWWCLRCLVA
ncbi:hypothetical protein Tco_0454346 [Tanacetum coccineum]